MTRSKSMALVLYLGAALAGAAGGVAIDRYVTRDQTRWWDQHAMRTRMYEELKLDQAQRDSADHIFDQRNRSQDSLVMPIKPSLDSTSALARQRLTQLLTPAQKTIYDQMQRDRQARDRQQHPEKK